MKKNVCFALSTAMLAMALVGCGKQAPVEEPETLTQEDTQTEAAPVEGTTTENAGVEETTVSVDTSALPEKYAAIVEMAAKAAAGQYQDDLMELEDNGISTVFGMKPGDTLVGYALKDIDGDGSDELLLGQNGTPDFDGWDGLIYNIYTLKDDELYVLANGGERDTYFITEDGTVGNVASGGATDSAYNYYKLEDKELKLIESVFCAAAEDNPEHVNWYHTKTEPFTDKSNKISEKKYSEITSNYSAEAIEFTPFNK